VNVRLRGPIEENPALMISGAACDKSAANRQLLRSETCLAMPEMSLTNHEEAFLLQHRKPI